MSDAAAEEVIEEVWTPKAAAEASALRQRQQPKSAKFSALAGGIPLAGSKSDDNLQPYVSRSFPRDSSLTDARDAGT
jgi:hypothetical protein